MILLFQSVIIKSVMKMENIFARSERLLGKAAMETLQSKRVIVFGLGGVGSYAAEALARCGVGHLTVVDSDAVDSTNINRQLYALHSTVGRNKAEVAAERILDINPNCSVTPLIKLYLPENADEFHLEEYDYIVDAIDNVSAKIDLAVKSEALSVPMVAAMGTGNKLDPTAFRIADIYKTSVCPLCRVMRRELKKRGVKHLKAVYSEEIPQTDGERTPASVSFVPPVAGFLLAREVILDLRQGERTLTKRIDD